MHKEIYIVGNGGREHAIGWKLKQDNSQINLNFISGNGGTQEIGKNHRSITRLKPLIRENKGIVVVGPDEPLASGLVNSLKSYGIRAFGPTREASELEWSKVWAQNFLQAFGIPCAHGEIFSNFGKAKSYVEAYNQPCVVKPDGLTKGKGVVVCDDRDEAIAALKSLMIKKEFGKAGETVVIQEKLQGKEVSIMAFCDGKVVIPMIPVRDYKRLLDQDQGPNTGGMGSEAPVWELVNPFELETIRRTILQPTIDHMRQTGRPYKGILYSGLMITKEGPKVLEFNCRFGDPETQVALPLLDNNLNDLFESAITGDFGNATLTWKAKNAVCVILASAGYTKKSVGDQINTRQIILGLENFNDNPNDDLFIFHAGTYQSRGHYYNSPGRVLGITATGITKEEARNKAYSVIDNPVKFPGMQYRKDIAQN